MELPLSACQWTKKQILLLSKLQYKRWLKHFPWKASNGAFKWPQHMLFTKTVEIFAKETIKIWRPCKQKLAQKPKFWDNSIKQNTLERLSVPT